VEVCDLGWGGLVGGGVGEVLFFCWLLDFGKVWWGGEIDLDVVEEFLGS
jgi:hypothetical protein